MCIRLHAQFLLILSYLNQTRISRLSFKNTQMSYFVQIRPVGVELFHADRRTHTTKLTVAFRNIANTPNNSTFYPHRFYNRYGECLLRGTSWIFTYKFNSGVYRFDYEFSREFVWFIWHVSGQNPPNFSMSKKNCSHNSWRKHHSKIPYSQVPCLTHGLTATCQKNWQNGYERMK